MHVQTVSGYIWSISEKKKLLFYVYLSRCDLLNISALRSLSSSITQAVLLKIKKSYSCIPSIFITLGMSINMKQIKGVHEGVLEGSGQHGSILKQFLIPNCRCKLLNKMFGSAKIPDEDHEVGVVVVHEGVLEGSGQHGTILKQFLIPNCRCKMLKMFRSAKIPITCWGPLGWDCRECPRTLRRPWDHIKADLLSKLHIEIPQPQRSIFANISLTCWGPWGWGCRGSWGCPRRLRPTWDHIKKVSHPKLHMQNG